MARYVNRLPHVQHLHRPDQFDAAMSDQVVLIAPRCRKGQPSGPGIAADARRLSAGI